MKKMTNLVSIFIKYITKPLILILVYLVLRDFVENIPYINLLGQTEGNILVVVWIVCVLLYNSSFTINKIIIASIIFLSLNVFSISVGLIIYISLFFIGFYYLKQLNKSK